MPYPMIGVRTKDIWEYVALLVKYDMFWGKDLMSALTVIGYSPDRTVNYI